MSSTYAAILRDARKSALLRMRRVPVPQGRSETITSIVRLIAVAIKIADKPIGVSFQAALDTPPGKINAVLMPTVRA
jgi:hypothetical protein